MTITNKELQELSKKKQKLNKAQEIINIEIQKLKTDSIQDGATTNTKFDKALKTNAGKRKTELREKAKKMQGEFNKKYYGEAYSEEGNDFIQNLLIESYVDYK